MKKPYLIIIRKAITLNLCLFLSSLSAQVPGETSQNSNGTESVPCITPTTTWFLGGNNISTTTTIGPNNPQTIPITIPIENNIGTCNSVDFILKAHNKKTIFIKTTSKVGISEPNPIAKFEVLEPTPLSGEANAPLLLTSIRSIVPNNFQHNEWIYRANSNNITEWWDVQWHDGISIDASFQQPMINTKTWWHRDPFADRQLWGSGATIGMILQNNILRVPGFIYIGTQVPNLSGNHTDAKLSVDGKILAKSIFVNIHNSNWADYVFEKDYKLMSLNKVEVYINKYKHLPNVPSASDLLSTNDYNLNLVEMQKIQMEKIEELFLYIIELQKEINKLKKGK